MSEKPFKSIFPVFVALLALMVVGVLFFWNRFSADINVPVSGTPDGMVNADVNTRGAPLEDSNLRSLLQPPEGVDLSRETVLLESFEFRRGELLHWGGGVASKDHATEGEKSFLVTFKGTASELECRPFAIVSDFSRHTKLLIDTFNPGRPFLVDLRLTATDQKSRFSFPPTQVPAGRSTLEFDLRLPRHRGFDLEAVGSLKIGRAAFPEATLRAFYDNLRLSRSGAARYEFFEEESLLDENPANFVLDGGFSRGLRLWRMRQLPGSLWNFSFSRGEEAFEGGPSLALEGRAQGGVELRGAEMLLPAGRYRASVYLKGDPNTHWEFKLREEVPGTWRILPGKPGSARALNDQWYAYQATFVVPRVEGSTPENPGKHEMSLLLTLTGDGNCMVDSISLTSVKGHTPDATELEVAESDFVSGRPLAWHEIGSSFPVFYLEESFLIDERIRFFRRFGRSLGLYAALDLGDLLHSERPAELLETVKRRKEDASVGAWLLTSQADWSLGFAKTDLVRGLSDRLSELDSRLVAVGLNSGDMSGLFRYSDAAGAFVVGSRSGQLEQPALEKFAKNLENAAKVTGIAGGAFLARANVGDRSLRQKLFLARIYGALGVVLDPPVSSLIADEVWDGAERAVREVQELSKSLQVASDLTVSASHNSVRVRGYRVDNRMILVVVSLWPKRLEGVTLESEFGTRTIDLEAWEALLFRDESR